MPFKILEVYARPDFPEKLRQHVVLSLVALLVAIARSEERRVGKEC